MKPFFQSLKVLYLALLGGQVIFAAVIYFLLSGEQSPNPSPAEPDRLFRLLAPLMVVGTAGVAYVLNRQRLGQGAEQGDLQAKSEHYRNTVILRSAMVEGGNLFALVATLITADTYLMLYFAAGFLAFLLFRPGKEEFAHFYELSRQEQQQLEQD